MCRDILHILSERVNIKWTRTPAETLLKILTEQKRIQRETPKETTEQNLRKNTALSRERTAKTAISSQTTKAIAGNKGGVGYISGSFFRLFKTMLSSTLIGAMDSYMLHSLYYVVKC